MCSIALNVFLTRLHFFIGTTALRRLNCINEKSLRLTLVNGDFHWQLPNYACRACSATRLPSVSRKIAI
jgi:hypothetical protein